MKKENKMVSTEQELFTTLFSQRAGQILARPEQVNTCRSDL